MSARKESPWEQSTIEKALLATVTEQRRARRWGIFFKLLLLSFVIYLFSLGYKEKSKPMLREHIALIDLVGLIGQGQEVEADNVALSLRRAFEEPKAKSIILRINSPGGSPVQSAYIYDEIMRLKALTPEKKVYAVVVDICASGGYFVASAADAIYANPSSVVGSIGVILPNFGFVGAIQKLGVQQRTLFSGENKTFLDPFSEEKPEQVAFAKTMLQNMHQHFIQAVKQGRGDRLKPNDQIFSGLMWTGEQALQLGLIDGLGSAGYVAREIVGTEEVVDYTIAFGWFDRIAAHFGSSFAKQMVTQLVTSFSAKGLVLQ